MVDRAGGTPAVGEVYFATGPIVKIAGTDITLAVGEGGSRGAGKPFTLHEGETLEVDNLLTVVAANAVHAASNHGGSLLYHFVVNESGTSSSADILHNGLILANIGDIVLPVACTTGKLGVMTWQSHSTPPTDWTFRLWKNGTNTKASSVAFHTSPSTYKYQTQDWATQETFAAGDRFRIEVGSTASSDATDVRMQIAMIFNTT